MVAVYERDPEMAPESEFEPGRLQHLVVGNSARLLDARRTPVRVVGLRVEFAFFEVEVLAFEDRGARWELPMDTVSRFQFALGEAVAEAEVVARYEEACRRFDSILRIEIDDEQRQATMALLAAERAVAAAWFEGHSTWAGGDRTIDPAAPLGDRRLFDDLARYMAARQLGAIEEAVARQYVSHPRAWEIVTGHAIVAAELGLAAYRGAAVRDQQRLSGDWSRERRAQHIVARMAFVSALFSLAGHSTVDLYRGMSFTGPVEWRIGGPFVSATFNRSIAASQAALGPHRSMGVLMSQRVSVERLFMTYHETAAMNASFREAEAVLLSSPTAVF